MTNNELIEKLSALHLPDDKYCLVGGAMMQLLNLRPLRHDIDLLVAPDLFEQLKQQDWSPGVVSVARALRYQPSGSWEFPLEALHCESFPNVSPSLLQFIQRANKIPGVGSMIPVILPMDMLHWKSKYVRHAGDEEDYMLLCRHCNVPYTPRLVPTDLLERAFDDDM